MMLDVYAWGTSFGKPLLRALLNHRIKKGKEDPQRLSERMGKASMTRPQGPLVWVHAASVGEAQSALILIERLLNKQPELNALVTTGTLTSAELMQKKLPKRAFHQFYPVDNPDWVGAFLEFWSPDAVFWMESELWPNMLRGIGQRNIPCALINARLSPKSFKRWTMMKSSAKALLKTFSVILCQTDTDAAFYKELGAENVHVTDNLKFSASPLAVDAQTLAALKPAVSGRPLWVYASSHAPEELLAARVHEELKNKHKDLLTVIVPRHPERRDEIRSVLSETDLKVTFRGDAHTPPTKKTDIYVADTLGELGLFYTVSDIALIGRSLSGDGGGGHNPIEAAQLGCAVLHGPLIQNLQDIYDDMTASNASVQVDDEDELTVTLDKLLSDQTALEEQQHAAKEFANAKTSVIDRVMKHVEPMLNGTQTKEARHA